MKRKSVFILKGNIVYSKNQKEFSICENGYVVCKDGIVEGVYKTLPFKFGGNPIRDYKDALIIPGFTDLHFPDKSTQPALFKHIHKQNSRRPVKSRKYTRPCSCTLLHIFHENPV